VFLFFFVRLRNTDFSAAEKDRCVKFCMRVRLLSGQVFSHFGERWLAWSHGGGITSGMSYIEVAVRQSELGAVARWAVGIGGGGVAYVRPYIWWDLRLASLLTHLFKELGSRVPSLRNSNDKQYRLFNYTLWSEASTSPSLVFGRPFVKRFALCYQTVVCHVCLSITFVHCGQTVGRIKMKHGTQVGLGPGHIVLDGDPAPPPQRGIAPNFRPTSVAAKWLHGSRCHLVWS